jgi:hypothetical protein
VSWCPVLLHSTGHFGQQIVHRKVPAYSNNTKTWKRRQTSIEFETTIEAEYKNTPYRIDTLFFVLNLCINSVKPTHYSSYFQALRTPYIPPL